MLNKALKKFINIITIIIIIICWVSGGVWYMMYCMMDITAAEVEPVGLKAN